MPKYGDAVNELQDSFLSRIFNRSSLSLVGFLVIGFVALVLSPSLIETNNAGFYSVKQAAGSGTLTAYTASGMFPQLFGDVTKYKASDIIYFSKHNDEGKDRDDSIEVRFNDGATAHVTGNVRIDLPANPERLVDIHKHFRSYDALIKDTVKQVVAEATILTASLMTAEESYTTKRAEFSQLAYDQLLNGVYLTEAEDVTVKDAKSGEQVIKKVVRIQRDDKGVPERKGSVLAMYGIKVGQFVVKEIDYEATVAGQIQSKQQALMQVVAAKANAEKAIQDRLTAEEVGRKNVAIARYEQEVKKQQAVTEAEQKLEVAKLNRAAEEQNKLANIAKGEGEGEYRRKLMVADGALDKKLETLEKIHEHWANALANSKNPIVPGVVMGENGAGAGNGINQFMQLMSAQAAKQLSVDVNTNTK